MLLEGPTAASTATRSFLKSSTGTAIASIPRIKSPLDKAETVRSNIGQLLRSLLFVFHGEVQPRPLVFGDLLRDASLRQVRRKVGCADETERRCQKRKDRARPDDDGYRPRHVKPVEYGWPLIAPHAQEDGLLQHVAQVDQQRSADTQDVQPIDRGPTDFPGGAAEIVAAVDGALLDQSFSNETDQIAMRLGGTAPPRPKNP